MWKANSLPHLLRTATTNKIRRTINMPWYARLLAIKNTSGFTTLIQNSFRYWDLMKHHLLMNEMVQTNLNVTFLFFRGLAGLCNDSVRVGMKMSQKSMKFRSSLHKIQLTLHPSPPPNKTRDHSYKYSSTEQIYPLAQILTLRQFIACPTDSIFL
jgi:hypothetical protein